MSAGDGRHDRAVQSMSFKQHSPFQLSCGTMKPGRIHY